MLSVAIHKDIAEYQPKVIGKLTGRTLISITVALGLSISVAVYMNLVLKIDPTDHLEFIYAVSLPCWCCGFWKKASCIESLAHIGGNAPVCGQNEIAR